MSTGLIVESHLLTCRYRVFLGHKQYFVSSDVGAGKMQWYAFHEEPTGGVDGPSGNASFFWLSLQMFVSHI